MHYTVQELIHNQSFRRMVRGEADTDEVNRWNQWIETSKEHREIAKEATAEIAGFEFKDPDFPDIFEEWNRLHRATTKRKQVKLQAVHHDDSLVWVYRAAVILVLAALTGVGIYIHSKRNQSLPQVEQITQSKTIQTGINEQTTITFTGGAKIVLNSQSTLRYKFDVLHSQNIKVVLQGEAYFEAVRVNLNLLFIRQTVL